MICIYLGSVIPGESHAWILVGWRGFSGRASDWLAEQPPTNQGPGCGIPVGGPAWVLAWISLGDPVSCTCRLSISSITVIIMYCCVEPAYIYVYKLHVIWSSICILYAHQQLVEIKTYIVIMFDKAQLHRNFQKSILVKIFEKSWFESKFSKNLDFNEKFLKSWKILI